MITKIRVITFIKFIKLKMYCLLNENKPYIYCLLLLERFTQYLDQIGLTFVCKIYI